MSSQDKNDNETNEYDSILDDIIDDYDFADGIDNKSYSSSDSENTDSNATKEEYDYNNIDYQALSELDKTIKKDPFNEYDYESTAESEEEYFNEYQNIPDDLSKLNALSAREEEEEDIDDIINAQYSINRNILKNNKTSSKNMIDDPIDYVKQYDGGAGDEKLMRKIFFAGIGLIIAAIVIAITVPILTQPDKTTVAGSSGQNISIGDIIGQSDTSNTGSQNNQNNSTSTPTDTSESVAVPDGGSKIDYSIKTEGDIQSVSVAWVNANGEAENAAGVSMPWNKTIGANANVTPVLAASTKGSGTITCTIIQDGKEIATKTVSGDSPEVTCEE